MLMQIQTEVTPGEQGALRQSWREHNPRDMLKSMMDAYPNETQTQILRRFSEAVSEDQNYLAVVIEYWFANNYRSLVRGSNPKGARAKPAPEIVAAKAATVEKIKERIKQEAIKLLDLVMSNGKPARENTFAFAAKEGGFWTKVSQMGKPKQRIGDVLSEDQIRKVI